LDAVYLITDGQSSENCRQLLKQQVSLMFFWHYFGISLCFSVGLFTNTVCVFSGKFWFTLKLQP